MGLSSISITIFLVVFINVFILCFADPRTFEAGLFCSNSTPPRNANYFPDFAGVMSDLSDLVAGNRSGHTFNNSTKPPIYALAECHRDLSETDCLLCFAVGRARLPHCLPAAAGRLYFDGCFLRYDDYDFFNESVNPVIDRGNCSSSSGGRGFVGGGEVERVEFGKRVGELIGNVTEGAVARDGFAVGEVKGVYGLAQCWRTVSDGGGGCKSCLEKAAAEVKKCVPSVEGRGLNAGCYLRYSTTKFFENGTASSRRSSTSRTGVIVGICLGVTGFVLFLFLATYAWFRRSSKLKQGNHKLGQLLNSFTKSRLNYKYEVLEKATDYFSLSTKIGQGGTGVVFKGTLPDGQCVAVKRLFFNTRQWVDEFFNEVNLITGIQHKNLVKLLGCSIEGPESLLVYEYVPNKSLDQFLFDKDKSEILSWKQRFEIVVGTAEGLAYLHGGTVIRIIHRDIKSSNVLLDENLSPKIADFGLVRSFGADKSHLSTGIAGTLGYMAPEYLVRGQLTEKADVYSFGVLVLEIVCGRRNNAFAEDSSSLLQMVWGLHKTDRLLESVDPRLEGYFNAEEAYRVLQIGLLCAQASAAERPSMENVVQMLVDRDSEIPQPYQPPFLNSTGAASDGKPNTTNSPISNVRALSSSESSRILSSDEPSTSG